MAEVRTKLFGLPAHQAELSPVKSREGQDFPSPYGLSELQDEVRNWHDPDPPSRLQSDRYRVLTRLEQGADYKLNLAMPLTSAGVVRAPSCRLSPFG